MYRAKRKLKRSKIVITEEDTNYLSLPRKLEMSGHWMGRFLPIRG